MRTPFGFKDEALTRGVQSSGLPSNCVLNIIVLLVILLGGVMRFYAPLTHDFPLNDGGLFLMMSQQLREQGFVLPTTIPYGASTDFIPFCYPPLAFYQVAFLSLFGFSLESLFRFIPAFWATATIYAFWRFAVAFFQPTLKRNELAVVAALIWALLPTSFHWLLMGGGLSRAPGLFFALLGAESALRLWRDGEQKKLWTTSVFFALAIATHLERAHFLAFTLIFFWAYFAGFKRWQSLWQLLAVFGGAIVLTSPWWSVCLIRFGTDPFLAASNSGGGAWHQTPLLKRISPEFFFPVVSVIAYAGILYHWRKLLPMGLWIALILITEVRTPSNFIIIPLAIAAAYTISSFKIRIARLALAAIAFIWLGLQSSMLTLVGYSSLSLANREAMQWVSQYSPPQSHFLVLPTSKNRSVGGWATDYISEWFPTLARRKSILTVQGSEWLPDKAFARQYQRRAQIAQARSWSEIKTAATSQGITFDAVYSPKENDKVTKLIQSQLRQSPEFKLAYENKDVLIFQRRKVTSPPTELNRVPSP